MEDSLRNTVKEFEDIIEAIEDLEIVEKKLGLQIESEAQVI